MIHWYKKNRNNSSHTSHHLGITVVSYPSLISSPECLLLEPALSPLLSSSTVPPKDILVYFSFLPVNPTSHLQKYSLVINFPLGPGFLLPTGIGFQHHLAPGPCRLQTPPLECVQRCGVSGCSLPPPWHAPADIPSVTLFKTCARMF